MFKGLYKLQSKYYSKLLREYSLLASHLSTSMLQSVTYKPIIDKNYDSIH